MDGALPTGRRPYRRVRMLGISKRGDTLSADPVDPWRPNGAHPREGADRVAVAVGQASSAKYRLRGAREQDGAHGLGLVGPVTGSTTRTSLASVPERGQRQKHGTTGGVPPAEVAQGTKRCDGTQVRPRPAEPEVTPGRTAHNRDEARVVLIPSGPAGRVLREQAEYRSATCFPIAPDRPLPPPGGRPNGCQQMHHRYGPSDDATPAAVDRQVRPEARFRPRLGGGQGPPDTPFQDGNLGWGLANGEGVHIGVTCPAPDDGACPGAAGPVLMACAPKT